MLLLSLSEFIGRFHPLLVHLPIGILLIALLLQALSRRQQFALGEGPFHVLWLCGTGSAFLSCITGYLLSLSGDYEARTVTLHMWMAIGVAGVSGAICWCLFKRRTGPLYHAACVALLLLILVTGHLGGSLTHGSDYLTAALADSSDPAGTTQKIIPNIQEATVYADLVQPMLQSNCYSCHGPAKQKGGLRMDSPDGLMKGGKEGLVIRTGQAEQSELIKRLLLAREEEHHMPPKGKPQLTERQVALLHWWIAQGADFAKKVKELPQPEKIAPVLLSFQGGAQHRAAPNVPEEPVEAADEKDLQPLRDRGAIVLPVAQNSHYMMVNLVTATGIKDADIKLLLPLKKQLVWLKAGNIPIGDPALQTIGQCTNLTVLQLNGTNITDKGLSFLQPLVRLQSLNLVGTNISPQGLLPLQALKKLQSIYLYQTHIKSSDWPRLHQAFSHAQLDTGGYTVPTFITDTTLMQPAEQRK